MTDLQWCVLKAYEKVQVFNGEEWDSYKDLEALRKINKKFEKLK